MSNKDYENRILLTVAGGSPAIVTEMLYALTQTVNKPFVPTEIHIITTSGGYNKIEETLVGEQGKIKQLCDDYGIERPIFAERNIHQISDSDGNILEDITSEADNESTADFITAKVREFTAKENTSLHVSIAGGRKTMTYYMGYAMSVFGRIQDTMSHVLVEDQYISPDFFYPTPDSHKMENYKKEQFDAKDVPVMLGYLPYIRLRDGLTDDLLNDPKKSYSEIIEMAQRKLEPPKVKHSQGKLLCGGKLVKLSHSLLALYLMILKRHKFEENSFIPNSREEEEKNAEEYLELYKNISNESGHYENLIVDAAKKHPYPYTNKINMEYFGVQRGKINEKIKKDMLDSLALAAPYLIKSLNDEGKKVRHNTPYYLSDELKCKNIDI